VLATGKAGSITATVMPFVFTLLLFLTIVTVAGAHHEHARGEGEPRDRGASSVSPFHHGGKIVAPARWASR
jgi:hypothetical protein